MPPKSSSVAEQILQQQKENDQRRNAPRPTESQTSSQEVVKALRQQQSAAAVSPKDLLKQFIVREVQNQNLLGLPLADIQAMSEVIATCSTKQEVFDWIQQTLMLPETVAAEVIKRRDDFGPFFAGQQTKAATNPSQQQAVAASSSAAAGGPERRSAATVAGATTAVPSGSALPGLPGTAAAGADRSRTINTNSKPGQGRSKKSIGDARKGTTMPLAGKQGPGKKPLVQGATFQCDCFALDHALVGNCLNCGRIICAQESLDVDCYHCGLDPKLCIAHEIKMQNGALDAAAQAKNRAGLEAALAKRDQLLKYAMEKTKRTTVVDDQSGVFGVQKSAWMSQTERDALDTAEAAARRKAIGDLHKQRGTYTVHLDIVNENVALGARVEDISQPGRHVDPTAAAAAAEEEVELLDEVDDDEQDNAAEEGSRIAPLPMLQKIWYNEDETLTVAALSSQLKSNKNNNNNANQQEGEGKAPVTRVLHVSSRLQNDYYSEDVAVWQEEEEHSNNVRRATQNVADPFSTPFDASRWRAMLDGADNVLLGGGGAPSATIASTASDALRDMVVQQQQAALEAQSPYTTIPKAMRHKDEGMCLSMHQPWASLLVAGIKTHEGRVWSTEFRGRLWIHAAAAKPTDVKTVEDHYRKFAANDKSLVWPEHYPTSCLLGYVYVLDCLDNATYTANIPPDQQQEDSPFKMMCAGATALGFPLQMDGKHKIFKLERKVWLAAKSQLGEKP